MKYFVNIKSLEDLKNQFRTLARKNHPDVGGDPEVMKAINTEYDKLFPIWKDRHNETAETPCYETASSTRSEFYTQNGWKGSKNDRSRSTKEVAALVRAYVKQNYPTWKFSIRFSQASMCSEIHIQLKEAPQPIWKEYSEVTFDEKMKIWTKAMYNRWMKQCSTFDDEADQELERAYQEHDFMKVYTELAQHVIDDIEREVKAYNYEDCDGMVDYFDTDFYFFGVKTNGYKVVPKTSRIQKTKKKVAEPVVPESQELPEETVAEIDQEYEIKEDVHTKTGEKIFVVKIVRTLERSEYLEVAEKMKTIGGSYSKFKHGFIFKEDPTELLVAYNAPEGSYTHFANWRINNMTSFRKLARKVIQEGEYKVYNIGFVNSDGKEDEIEFDSTGLDDLEELWMEFAYENGFDSEKVLYVYCNGDPIQNREDKRIVDVIAEKIDSLGLSQQKAADRCGMSRQRLWDALDKRNPRFQTVARIAEGLGVEFKLMDLETGELIQGMKKSRFLEAAKQMNLAFDPLNEVIKTLGYELFLE